MPLAYDEYGNLVEMPPTSPQPQGGINMGGLGARPQTDLPPMQDTTGQVYTNADIMGGTGATPQGYSNELSRYGISPQKFVQIQSYSPEQKTATAAKIDAFGLEENEAKALKAVLGLPTGEGKEFAPDVQIMVDPTTNQTKPVNFRDPAQVAAAEEAGLVALGPQQEGYLKKIGEYGAEKVKEITDTATKARGNKATLQTMSSLLDRFESGRFAGAGLELQKFGEALGLDVDTSNMAAKEAFRALGEKLTLQSRNLGEGMVLAGQMSDRDVQFLRNMNPQLTTTTEGNKLIMRVAIGIADRQQEILKATEEYRKKHGGVVDPLGLENYLSGKFDNTSIFGIPEGAVLTGGTHKATGLPVYELDGEYYTPDF